MSRLLHTSDWHVGHTLHGYPRTDDFDAVFAEIVEIARESRPDLIVHTGDLFHTSHPTAADLIRAMEVLKQLAAVAPTVVVAGNHDSPTYFRFFDLFTGPSVGRGLFFVDRLRTAEEGGVFTFDACGGEQRIRLAAMPFVHPNRFWQRPALSTSYAEYAAGMRGLQQQLLEAMGEGYDPDRDVLFFAAHVYVAGATRAETERRMDESFKVAVEDLPQVSYTALGHIHCPQTVRGPTFPARYAGSPLAMDFGEVGDPKSVVIVDAEPGRPGRPLPRRLLSARRLEVFEGTLDRLRAEAAQYDGTYLKAVISGEEPDVQLARKIAEIVPNAIVIKATLDLEPAADILLDFAPGEEPELPDAFRVYLGQEGVSGAAANATVAAFVELLNEVDTEAPSPVPAEQQLRAALEDTWTEET
ncbi:exonuclease SbcCD subunit D [Streptomyces sp. NPDC093085]|uniref:metallophosphoesterase family protein n=1 Tax=Streptomyces sp. NPDC093085 TaxID=3155068 RepID=UPI003414CCD2